MRRALPTAAAAAAAFEHVHCFICDSSKRQVLDTLCAFTHKKHVVVPRASAAARSIAHSTGSRKLDRDVLIYPSEETAHRSHPHPRRRRRIHACFPPELLALRGTSASNTANPRRS